VTEPLRVFAPTPTDRTATASPNRLAGRFPDDTDADRTRPRLVRIGIGIVAVVLVVVVGLYATGAFAGSDSSYRTATAGRHDVDAVISTVGVLEPVSQATVAFPVSGTVATVSVNSGDQVVAGQQLAGLDTQSLTTTLHEKQADLAQAELTLAKALNGESVAPSGGSGSIRTASTNSTNTGGSDVVLTAATIAPSTNPQLAPAQQAVLDAQKKVDQTLAAADQAMATADATCSAAGVGTTTTTTAAAADPVQACKEALAAVQTAQAAVAAAQKQLATASSQLDALLAQQAASAGSGGTGTTDGTPNSGSVPSGSTGSSPSSADLVSYQKAVDAAEVEVTAAEQALAQATLVSPIAGDVVAVNLAVGDDVSAGSSTANIVIEGSGGYEATTNLSVDDITRVAVGQRAEVRLDGTGATLGGKVVAISAAPSSSSSSSTTTYRVTVALDRPDADIRNGATATVDIITGSATAAVAVPTSAVTTNGSRHSVVVLDGGSTETVQVEVGVVGATWTEIRRGLRAGQSVVLATVSDPLPDSATNSSNADSGPSFFPRGGGAGGFPNFGGR
jgi:multidrug efflux pump subunit AcrA (membrane-fusion protein)